MKKTLKPVLTVLTPPVQNFSTSAPQPRPVATPDPDAKREKIFSQSRDMREDRSTRQIKTTKKTRTFPHPRSP